MERVGTMEHEPIRILHVIGIMNRGGAETMIMNLYRNIDRDEVQFDFVENEGNEAAFDAEIRQLGGKIYRCPHYNGKNHFTYIRWWNSFFKAHKGEYPIVHGHIGSTAAIYLSIAKKHGAYTIAHSHSAGSGSAMYRMFAYPTRHIADKFFACSKDAGISRYGKTVGNDSNRCQILNNAIDARRFSFNQETRKQVRNVLHIAENSIVIGHVGRFVEAKNHLFLIDVFADVRKHDPNAVLLLVGDGERRPEIQAAIAETHLEKAVILAGVRSNVWDFYQAMDVFVFPSVYEGLPVSLVEAQAAGLPCCVSSNVPRDSAITDLVEYIPLENGPDKWAEIVLQSAKTSRTNMLREIQNAGFDVSSTANWLKDFYLNVVKSCGKKNQIDNIHPGI